MARMTRNTLGAMERLRQRFPNHMAAAMSRCDPRNSRLSID